MRPKDTSRSRDGMPFKSWRSYRTQIRLKLLSAAALPVAATFLTRKTHVVSWSHVRMSSPRRIAEMHTASTHVYCGSSRMRHTRTQTPTQSGGRHRQGWLAGGMIPRVMVPLTVAHSLYSPGERLAKRRGAGGICCEGQRCCGL